MRPSYNIKKKIQIPVASKIVQYYFQLWIISTEFYEVYADVLCFWFFRFVLLYFSTVRL